MYLENTEGVIKSRDVKIKYDCDGGFETCGQERMLKLRYAEKNFGDNGGKHICRKCFMKNKNPMKSKEVQEKIKKTCLEKYGTEMPVNKKELVEERKAKFKDEEFKKQWVEKHRQTSLERYGVEHPMHLKETKERQRQTIQEKYGVDHAMQSEEVKKKTRKTNMERYGVENAAQSPEVRVKMAQTTLQRYGVEHYNQLPEMKDYLRENCREWLAKSWANPWAKGIVRPEEWNQKQSQRMTEKILSGDFNPEDKRFYITGYFTSPKCKKERAFFRSSLELMMHYIFDNDEDIVWYENEPFAIQYEKAPGVVRNYIPDFFAFRKSKCPLLAEIKPAFRMREQEVGYKVDAGQKFCKQNGFEFIYIDEKYLRSNSIDLKQLKMLAHVELCQVKA
jgi:hypothetical protein